MPSHSDDREYRISEALAAHARGWLLTPLRGKQPYLDGWQRQPAPSERDIRQWARAGNVGLRTGPASGVIVIDEDRPKGGSIVEALGSVPWTVTVETGGGGRHFYFVAPEPCPGNSAGKLAPHVDVRGEGGQVVFPGSIHPDTKQPYRWGAGLGPDDVPISELAGDVLERLASPAPTAKPLPAPSPAPAGLTRYAARALEAEVQAVASSPEGTRNDALNRAAFNLGQLVGGGVLPQGLVEGELSAAAEGAGLSGREIAATIRSGLTKGIQQPRRPELRPVQSVAGPPGDELEPAEADDPEILVPGAYTDDDGVYIEIGNDDFAEAVLRAVPPGVIYRRDQIAGEIVGDPGNRKFRLLTGSRLRVLVDQHSRLVRWVKRKSDSKAKKVYVNCSRDHASILLDHAGIHQAVREMQLLVSYPVFLGSDLKLAEPGWNERYGVYYDEPPDLEGLETNATQQQAWDALHELVVDFPFKDEASRQNFFGLLLTPLLRPALSGNVPMHLLLSPLERTGKTKLAEQVLGGIVLGRPAPSIQLSGSEEERDKRILALLLRSDTICHLDNVREYLDSGALSSLLTSATYSGRPLGQSRIIELPNILTIVASGNNVRATGELVKRTVPIQLQPLTDCPENRVDFHHPDLQTYTREARRGVLAGLISAVMRWRDGSRTPGRLQLGGFEDWARIVGGVLYEAALTKWRTNQAMWARSADPTGEDLRAFVTAWEERWGTSAVSPGSLMQLAEEEGLFPFAFKATTERGRLISFSMKVLAKHVDSPCGQWIIRADGSGSSRKLWLEEEL